MDSEDEAPPPPPGSFQPPPPAFHDDSDYSEDTGEALPPPPQGFEMDNDAEIPPPTYRYSVSVSRASEPPPPPFELEEPDSDASDVVPPPPEALEAFSFVPPPPPPTQSMKAAEPRKKKKKKKEDRDEGEESRSTSNSLSVSQSGKRSKKKKKKRKKLRSRGLSAAPGPPESSEHVPEEGSTALEAQVGPSVSTSAENIKDSLAAPADSGAKDTTLSKGTSENSVQRSCTSSSPTSTATASVPQAGNGVRQLSSMEYMLLRLPKKVPSDAILDGADLLLRKEQHSFVMLGELHESVKNASWTFLLSTHHFYKFPADVDLLSRTALQYRKKKSILDIHSVREIPKKPNMFQVLSFKSASKMRTNKLFGAVGVTRKADTYLQRRIYQAADELDQMQWVLVLRRLITQRWQQLCESKFIPSPEIYQRHSFVMKRNKYGQSQARALVLSTTKIYNVEVAHNPTELVAVKWGLPIAALTHLQVEQGDLQVMSLFFDKTKAETDTRTSFKKRMSIKKKEVLSHAFAFGDETDLLHTCFELSRLFALIYPGQEKVQLRCDVVQVAKKTPAKKEAGAAPTVKTQADASLGSDAGAGMRHTEDSSDESGDDGTSGRQADRQQPGGADDFGDSDASDSAWSSDED